jgi:hypothetical protein
MSATLMSINKSNWSGETAEIFINRDKELLLLELGGENEVFAFDWNPETSAYDVYFYGTDDLVCEVISCGDFWMASNFGGITREAKDEYVACAQLLFNIL